MGKVTESSISNTILLQAQWQQANDKVLQIKCEVDGYQVAVDTLDQKKKALECIVQLRLADYFSEPRIPKGVPREKMDEALRSKKKRLT